MCGVILEGGVVFYLVCGVLVIIVLFFGMKVLRKVGPKQASGVAPRSQSQDEVFTPVYVLLFRNAPIELTEDMVRGAYEKAFQITPRVKGVPTSDGLSFIAMAPKGPPLAFIRGNRPRTSPEATNRLASELRDPAAAKGVREHTSWISVEAIANEPPPSDMQLLQTIQMMLSCAASSFVDKNTTVVMLPLTSRAVAVNPETKTQLFEMRLHALFNYGNADNAVFSAGTRDPAIDKAIEEAQRRLPEYLLAMRDAGKPGAGIFKAKFVFSEDGHSGSEYIWMSYAGADDGKLHGVIENDPVATSLPKKGSRVTVRQSDVVDWFYLDKNNKPVGMFVERVLTSKH
jgi:uncharacterized protein YegJ (DUF2314 family)